MFGVEKWAGDLSARVSKGVLRASNVSNDKGVNLIQIITPDQQRTLIKVILRQPSY